MITEEKKLKIMDKEGAEIPQSQWPREWVLCEQGIYKRSFTGVWQVLSFTSGEICVGHPGAYLTLNMRVGKNFLGEFHERLCEALGELCDPLDQLSVKKAQYRLCREFGIIDQGWS